MRIEQYWLSQVLLRHATTFYALHRPHRIAFDFVCFPVYFRVVVYGYYRHYEAPPNPLRHR